MNYYLPPKRGLYDPAFEHDACGVGFIAHIKGEKSHRIIEQAIRILVNLTHRGAVGSDALTGDGAGLLFQLPDEFFRNGTAGLDFDLPPAGRYAVGMVFLPGDRFACRECMCIIEEEAESGGMRVLGWREVPIDREAVGQTARANCPVVKQVFLEGPEMEETAIERRLYMARRRIEKRIAEPPTPPAWTISTCPVCPPAPLFIKA